jgi:hypothetical protein
MRFSVGKEPNVFRGLHARGPKSLAEPGDTASQQNERDSSCNLDGEIRGMRINKILIPTRYAEMKNRA